MSRMELSLKSLFMQLKHIIIFFSVLFIFIRCENNPGNTEPAVSANALVRYANHFSIQHANNRTTLYVFGNKSNRDTTSIFVLYTDSLPPQVRKNEVAIKIPCKNIAALSSIYARMLYELGSLGAVKAIDNIDYVTCESILRKHQNDSLLELARGVEIDLEQCIVLRPDIIFSFGMGDWEKDRNRKMEQLQIPLALSVDHLEESPLARAEWIKFFAAFVCKDSLADSIFDSVEKNYKELQTFASTFSFQPTVFNELKYSDSWYMPGGKSYIARILKDAGADYLWKSNPSNGSIPLSFEQVYAIAKDADVWINLSTLTKKEQLLSYESRYSEFKAYRTGQLYNNNLHTNKNGYSNYWETGMIFPDKILSDLIRIFHPETKTQLGQEFNYYRQLP